MYIGDVGQSTREELDFVTVSPVGYDFGWSRYEGSVCNPNDHDPSCSTSGLTFPVHEYGRGFGQSVTGGVVYRGDVVRSLEGFYMYSDVLSGRVAVFRVLNGAAVDHQDLTGPLGLSGLVSFATDSEGEMLAVSLFGGSVHRLQGG